MLGILLLQICHDLALNLVSLVAEAETLDYAFSDRSPDFLAQCRLEETFSAKEFPLLELGEKLPRHNLYLIRTVEIFPENDNDWKDVSKLLSFSLRSEERRVGKECKLRIWPET